MKTYYAVIEICKIYHEGPFDSFIWQKPCKSRKEAAAFIKRVGKGKNGLYWVSQAHIDVE